MDALHKNKTRDDARCAGWTLAMALRYTIERRKEIPPLIMMEGMEEPKLPGRPPGL
jgi:hypothetical protein